MKSLKKFLTPVIAGLILILIIGFLLPAKITVERSSIIYSQPSDIFTQINSLGNWKNWFSMLKDEHPQNNFSMLSDKKATWQNSRQIMEANIIESVNLRSLRLNSSLYLFNLNATENWKLECVEGGTKVTWKLETSLGKNLLRRFQGLSLRNKISSNMEKSLQNLKIMLEKGNNQTIYEMNGITIEPLKTDGYKMISITETFPTKERYKLMKPCFDELSRLFNKSRQIPIGSPLTVYHKYNQDSVTIEMAIPVEKEIKTEGRIRMSKLEGKSVVAILHSGDYSKIDNTYKLMEDWFKQNQKPIKSPFWEVYLKNQKQDTISANWRTQIFYLFE